MWIEINSLTYHGIRQDLSKTGLLVVFGTFSDSLGISEIGYGRPYMSTEWGIKECENPVIWVEMTKESVEHDWEYKYYLFTK